MKIVTIILCFPLGWCLSEAYITGPKKHYAEGYKAARDEIIEKIKNQEYEWID